MKRFQYVVFLLPLIRQEQLGGEMSPFISNYVNTVQLIKIVYVHRSSAQVLAAQTIVCFPRNQPTYETKNYFIHAIVYFGRNIEYCGSFDFSILETADTQSCTSNTHSMCLVKINSKVKTSICF